MKQSAPPTPARRARWVAALAVLGSATTLTGIALAHPDDVVVVDTRTGGPRPSGNEHITIHDPYVEANHFSARRLRLNGGGPQTRVQVGATVHAELEINQHCAACQGLPNEIIVGFAGDTQAAACVWSGATDTNGWRNVSFTLTAPAQRGVYEIRIRPSAAGDCNRALGWWRHERPEGPSGASTIGVLIVDGPAPATTTSTAATTTPPAPVVPAPLLANGGFEAPAVAARTAQVQSTIPGWQRGAGTGIEVQNDPTLALTGQQFVSLDGVDATTIFQDVATEANRTYVLKLAFSPEPGSGWSDNQLEVRWNGEVVAVLSASGDGRNGPAWQRTALRVRATGTTTRLELRDAGSSNGHGTWVDDVSVERAP